MNSLRNLSLDLPQPTTAKRALVLAQFFLIIFVYHILKDLKDTLVITGSDAGAQMIPFVKVWVILPSAVAASYIFSKLYFRYGREKTFYIFVVSLLTLYWVFAFILYPASEHLYLDNIALYLTHTLPTGAGGFIDMICYWFYSLFYVSAELWSIMILSVLFWGRVNEMTSLEESKEFYPKCFITGNIAGIISGLTSSQLCKILSQHTSWKTTLQCMIVLVSVCGVIIMELNRRLARYAAYQKSHDKRASPRDISFKDSCLLIFRSRSLFCIALIVVGYALTSNLLEVTMKESIKAVYSLPQEYNAYVNWLTSLIGFLAVMISLSSKWLFKTFGWLKVALATPVALFLLSSIYFYCHIAQPKIFVSLSSEHFIFIIGSVYYVISTSAKYTVFDMTKEIAFLTVPSDARIRGKLVIDTVGSRLGKTGASGLYQVLLITLGASTFHIPIIGAVSILFIGLSIFATQELGRKITYRREETECVQ